MPKKNAGYAYNPIPYHWTEKGAWMQYMSDLTVIVSGGRRFQVHKAILERRTDFFNNHYRTNYKSKLGAQMNRDQYEGNNAKEAKIIEEKNTSVNNNEMHSINKDITNDIKHKVEVKNAEPIKDKSQECSKKKINNKKLISRKAKIKIKELDNDQEDTGNNINAPLDDKIEETRKTNVVTNYSSKIVKCKNTNTPNKISFSWVENNGFIMIGCGPPSSEELEKEEISEDISDTINEETIITKLHVEDEINYVKEDDNSIENKDKDLSYKSEVIYMPYLNERAFAAFLDFVYNCCNEDTGYTPKAIPILQMSTSRCLSNHFSGDRMCSSDMILSKDIDGVHHPASIKSSDYNDKSTLNQDNKSATCQWEYIDEENTTTVEEITSADEDEKHKLPDDSWWGWPDTPEEMLSLYRVCTKWKCPLLGDSIASRLADILDRSGAHLADIALAAWTSGHELGTWSSGDPRFRNCVLNQFDAIADLDWTYDLPMRLLKSMLKEDRLNVWRGEEWRVLRFVLRWTVGKNGRRIAQLLDNVRLEMIDVESLSNETRIWISRLPSDSMQVLDKAWRHCKLRNDYLRYGITVEMPSDMVIMRPRICRTQVFLLGGWHNSKPITELDALDPRCDQWFHLPCSALTARQRRRRQEKAAEIEMLEECEDTVYRVVRLCVHGVSDLDALVVPLDINLPTRAEVELPGFLSRGRTRFSERGRAPVISDRYRNMLRRANERSGGMSSRGITRRGVLGRSESYPLDFRRYNETYAYTDIEDIQVGGAIIFEYHQDLQSSTELIRGWDQSLNREFAQRRSQTITRTWYPSLADRIQREDARDSRTWQIASVDSEAKDEWERTDSDDRFERFKETLFESQTTSRTSQAQPCAGTVSLTSLSTCRLKAAPSAQYRSMPRTVSKTSYPSPGHSHRLFSIGARAYHGLTHYKGWIYVVGGTEDGIGYLNTAYKFLADTGEVRTLPPMTTRRCYVTATTCLGRVYALGGYSGVRRMSSVDVYSPDIDEWKTSANMNTSRSDASCDTHDDKIYIAGGYRENECMSECERYDPSTNQWTLLAPMSIVRSGLGLVSYKGIIYSLGGFNGRRRTNTMERYDPKSNVWKTLKPMPTPRSNFAIFLLEGRIYAAGGFDGTNTSRKVECYDPELDVWTEAPPLLTSKSAVKAICVQGLSRPQRFGYYSHESTRDLRRKRHFQRADKLSKRRADFTSVSVNDLVLPDEEDDLKSEYTL